MMIDCEYDKKMIWFKKYGLLFFKQKCHILTHYINIQRRIIGDFGLHKLIFVLLQLTIIISLMTKSGVTTESGGRQNMFPSETRPYIDETVSYDGYPQNAEKVNGRWAMVGFVALLGAYVTTGQIIPGIFQLINNFFKNFQFKL